MWAFLPLVVLVAAQDALIITVVDYFVDLDAGLQNLDAECEHLGQGIAMVCVPDGRRWDGYAGVPVFSGNRPCGTFPSLSAPISYPAGCLPTDEVIFTGCDATGAPVADDAAACNNWTTNNHSLRGVVGQPGAIGTAWLNASEARCSQYHPFIYCVQVLEPAIYLSRHTVHPSYCALDDLDYECRHQSEDYPFTFALVCDPSRDWLALKDVPFVDLVSSVPLGYPFNNFTLDNPVTGTGNGVEIFTACHNNLTYAGDSEACFSSGGTSIATTAGDNTSLWLSDGVPRDCNYFSTYCVRSSALYKYFSKAPTTRRPSRQPTTKAPTTPAPSRAPTTPGQAPSSQPTSVPIVIVLTNATGNVTQNVTVPGNVTIIVPNLLFLYGNSTSKIVIGRGNLSDFVPSWLLGGGSLVSVDVIVDGEVVEVSDLSVPIEFVMPRDSAMCEAQRTTEARCMWRDVETNTWRPDNCTTITVTLIDGTPATLCKCNHLTDFAVLLDRETFCDAETASESFLVFAGVYVLIALYCFVVVVRLQMIRERESWFLRAQHISIGAVAFIRMLSCLRYYDLLGDELAFEAVITTLPYLIEFWIFTRLVSTWLGLVEFTFLASGLQWHKIRPWLFGVNIVGSLFTIALFIAFLVQLDYTTALVGTIGIATVYILLAVVFLYYSSQLVTSMAAPIKRSTGTSDGNATRGCSLGTRILVAGRASAFCFAMQAVSSVLALVLERELIVVFSALFMAFNCVALIGLLMLYHGAVQKGLHPKVSVSSMSRASGHELGSMKSTLSTA